MTSMSQSLSANGEEQCDSAYRFVLNNTSFGKKNYYVGGLAKFLVVLFCYKRSLVKQQSYKSCVICNLFLFHWSLVH